MAMASDITGEVLNVVTGVETTVARIAEILLEITGSDLTAEYADTADAVKATSSASLKLSREKIGRMLGWEPQIGVDEGIRRLIAWRAAQP